MSLLPRGPQPRRSAAATAVAAVFFSLFVLAAAGATGVLPVMTTGARLHQAAGDLALGPVDADGDKVKTWRLGILVGGDMLFDLSPGSVLAAEGAEAVLAGWSALRRQEHIHLGLANLECPLTVRGEALPGKKYTFRADPELVPQALAGSGFDAVSLANNHILDYGQAGLDDTRQALAAAGVVSFGAGMDRGEAYAPVLLQRDGLRIALLAFGSTDYLPSAYQRWWAADDGHPGIAPIEPRSALLATVARACTEADVVIVSMHWGLEYHQVTAEQQQLGRAIIEAGADVVFGHHPHVPQPVEFWHGRPIIYSLGNLVFHGGQTRARQMMVAEVIIDGWRADAEGGKYNSCEVRLHGLVNNGGRTETMGAAEALAFLGTIKENCRQFGTPAVLDGTVLVLTPSQ